MNHLFHPQAEVIVSLQGSLDSFALPDVLVLLSSTKKDGELRVASGRVEGRLWLEKGQVVHAEVGRKDTSAIDAVFELLRLESGTFSFHSEATAPRHSEPVTIDAVLADAQVRLVEWVEISRVVPTLNAVIDMAAEAPADEVKVSRDQWHLLRTVAGGLSVSELMAVLGRSEFDTCKTVKQLVDFKLASIEVKPAGRSEAGAPQAGASASAPSSPFAAAPARPVAPAVSPAEPAAARVRERSEEPEKSDPTKEAAAAAAAAENELDALAELASRPRKVRTTTSDAIGPGNRPAATRLSATKPGGFGSATPAQPEQGQALPASRAAEEPKSAEEARALVAQLAALGGDDEEKVAQKVAEHLASGGELPDVPEGDEPINRGLLLKFLSSVRS